MISRKCLFMTAIVAAIFVLSIHGTTLVAQTDRPGMDPQKCAALQRQMDQIVAIADSPSLSEKEKMSRLSQSLMQSMATMMSNTRNDPEAAKIAQEWRETLMKVMSSADISGRAADTNVSGDAKRGVDLVKQRIQPYIGVMKLLCPDLVVPKAVGR
jgi:hypothetical protein